MSAMENAPQGATKSEAWCRRRYVNALHTEDDLLLLAVVSLRTDGTASPLLFLCTKDRVRGDGGCASRAPGPLRACPAHCAETGCPEDPSSCPAGAHVDLAPDAGPGFAVALPPLPLATADTVFCADKAFVALDPAGASGGFLRVVRRADTRDTIGLRVAAAFKAHAALARYRSAIPVCCGAHTGAAAPAASSAGSRSSEGPPGAGCRLGAACPYLHVEASARPSRLRSDMPLKELTALLFAGRSRVSSQARSPVMLGVSGCGTVDNAFTLDGGARDEVPPPPPPPQAPLPHVRQEEAALLRVAEFCGKLERRHGLRTVGDVSRLSTEVFRVSLDAAAAASRGDEVLWAALKVVRELPDELGTADAHARLFGRCLGTGEVTLLQEHSVATVRELRKMKFATFLALPIPAALASDLQTIRERRREKETASPFEVVDLGARGDGDAVSSLVRALVSYQNDIDTSWKKSACSQVVSTVITYAPGCACVKGRAAPRMCPYRGASATAPPGPGGWCTCTRETVFSTNYELSTPSGSRCSEQNGLGQLAAMGHPTSCIREVYVRGYREAGADPNPLFPCGVCEQMFRKLSKDVFRKHQAEITLFMLDSQSPQPRKLITMPFSEISNRASQRFKSFVDSELRDDVAA
eukprot:Rhum_TRINITY_DN10546_c0_g1::Rhum_TRINITY_DN10546_c0_g1_i1::g.38979::m.38979